VQRHLSALETALAVGSRAGPLPLAAAGGRFAVAAAGTAADALPFVGRAFVRSK
jgi:hypothetical protein